MGSKSNGKTELTALGKAILDRIDNRGRTAADIAKEMQLEHKAVEAECLELIRRGLATTLAPIDGETVFAAVEGKAAEAARAEGDEPSPEERRVTIMRRARVLVLLDGAALTPMSVERLVIEIPKTGEPALYSVEIDHVDGDLVALRDAKLAEFRSKEQTGAGEGWILTLAGSKAVADRGYINVAEESVEAEERAADDEPGEADADEPSGATWGDAAKASEEADRADKADAKPARRTGLQFPRSEVRPLLAKIPEERHASIRAEHYATLNKIDAVEAERKGHNERLNARRKELESREAELRPLAETGLEPGADVRCTLRLDGSTVRVIRDDTTEVIEERAATKEELEAARQLPLAFDGKGAAAPASVPDATPEPKKTAPKPTPEEAVRRAFNGGAPVSKAALLSRVAGVDPKDAARVFEELREAGAVVKEGAGKGTTYRLAAAPAETAATPS